MTSQPGARPGLPWRTTIVGSAFILGLPWLFVLLDRGSGDVSWALVQLVVLNPVLFVVGSIRSWFRYSWKFLLTPLAYSFAFLISVFVVYNASALPYLAVYIGLVVVVWLVVFFISKTRGTNPKS